MPNNTKQYLLKVNYGDETLVWRTDKCGSAFGPNDWIIHLAGDKKKVTLVAHVQQQANRTWGCRVAEGADPLLVLAMILCADRFRILDEDTYRKSSGMQKYGVNNVFY